MSLPTNLSKPNTLIAGTDALAADINGNLDYIITAQNASNTQTNTNTDEIVTARNGAASLDDRLDAADTDRNLKAYANNASLTGIPTAPTAAVDTNTTQLATTAFAKKEADDAQAFAIQRANHTGTQPQSTIDNLITDIAAVQSYSTQRANHTGTQPQSTIDNLVSDLASKIGANNAALTGVPTAPTAATGTNTTQIATTEFVRTAAFNSALPAQTGNSGKFVTTDGSNASWAAIPKVEVILYANRATLRSMTPDNGSQIIVEDLGLFVFFAGSTEPDDDETCFATATGCWLVEALSWDAIYTYLIPEFDACLHRIKTSFNMTLITLASITSYDFVFAVNGAAVGDPVIVAIGGSFGTSAADKGRLSYCAYVSAENTVTVSIRNASAAAASMTPSTWNVTVIK